MHFRPRNGQYHMPKRCLLQDEKMAVECKPLMFSVLCNPLIFRVFASDGESARKNSLIFWGRTENSDEKIARRFKFESARIALLSAERNNAYRGLKLRFFIEINFPFISADFCSDGRSVHIYHVFAYSRCVIIPLAMLSLYLYNTGFGSTLPIQINKSFFVLSVCSPFTIFS